MLVTRSPRRRKLALAATAAVSIAAVTTGARSASAQITTIDKGHNLLLNSGLQIWGLNTDSFQYTFNYNNLTAANMDAVQWSYGQSNPGALTTGQRWGKWVQPDPGQSNYTSPANSLNSTEIAHKSDLVSIQVGDEQQSDLENVNGYTKAWFDAAHSGGHFTDKLMYINSTFWNNTSNFINFIGAANPDAISFDAYPFGTTGVYPYNWLGKAQFYRRVSLGSYIGATGTSPRPYGLYLQTYHGGDGARDPGDLEMRWQQFTAWTLGYTFVDCFTAGGGNTSLFVAGNGNSPNQPNYNNFKESARQSKNLGPALVRLISYGYGPNIILGKDATGAINPIPADWPTFNKTNAPPSQQYLTGITAQNLGTKNGGQPGDVYVGWFNPLHTSFGDPAGTAYFMVTNALGAYLQDASLTPADCTQRLTMDFDMGWTTTNSLQRLNRNTGVVDTIPLTLVSGTQYRLSNYDLEGGTGDLFKYNDGSPFVGVQPVTPTVYWDGDGNAAGNNTTTGAGLGGNGNWDSFNARWYNGASNGNYGANYNPVFWGTAGTVTIVSPPSTNSITFKTNGYTITGSSILLNQPYVTCDAGVTATINSTLNGGSAGLVKNGPGTLKLAPTTGSNTFTGLTINDGVVQVNGDGALGTAPAALATNISLNGGTLQFGANFDLGNTRAIGVGPLGGTIDTNGFSNPSGWNPTNGFRGPGNITKTGAGTFFASQPGGGFNTLWTGNLILKQGTWKIIGSDGLPYNVPAADGLKPAQITFDGGTWQMGTTLNITNFRRGITVNAGGGTIDTQGFDLTWAGPLAGSVATSNLNKAGAGKLTLKTSATLASYAGIFNVNAGTLELNGGGAMGDLASINVNNGGSTLSITGNETVGSVAGAAGTTVSLGSGVGLYTGSNNNSTSFAGWMTGAGSLNKAGSGTMTLSGTNDYAGPTTVTAGTLAFSAPLHTTSSVAISSGAAVRLNAGSHIALATGSITTAGTGKLDITDNSVVVRNSTLAAVKALITTGYNGGNWQGAGITSSSAPANSRTAIGVGANSALGKSSFAGVTGLDSNDVLVKYTYYGDADLTGATTLDDFTLFLNGYQNGGTTWSQGDFDYNGVTTLDDFTLFLLGYQQQGAPLSEIEALVDSVPMSAAERAAMLAAVQAVPEPGTGIAMLAAAAVGVGAMRRQRREMR
jgi:autotransporter-associated beta strand protein